MNPNINYHFDQLSTLDTLFDYLKPLLYSQTPLTDEIIKKTSHLLIDSFMSWYRSLSFYSLLNTNLNHYILNNRWSKYILFVLCYFLTNTIHKNFLSYNQCLQRLMEYQERYFLQPISQDIIEQFRNMLIQLNSLHLTHTEFTLLSILIVVRYGKKKTKT